MPHRHALRARYRSLSWDNPAHSDWSKRKDRIWSRLMRTAERVWLRRHVARLEVAHE